MPFGGVLGGVQVVEALVHTVAYSLMEPSAFTSGTFYPALVTRYGLLQPAAAAMHLGLPSQFQ